MLSCYIILKTDVSKAFNQHGKLKALLPQTALKAIHSPDWAAKVKSNYRSVIHRACYKVFTTDYPQHFHRQM